jgi:hypothetical protein
MTPKRVNANQNQMQAEKERERKINDCNSKWISKICSLLVCSDLNVCKIINIREYKLIFGTNKDSRNVKITV